MSSSVFSGRVLAVVFEDNAGFYITRIRLDDGLGATSTKGHFPGQRIIPGTWVCFEGSWFNHPVHGRQLSVVKSPVVPDTWTDEQASSIMSANKVGPSHISILCSIASNLKVPLANLLDAGSASFGEVSGLTSIDVDFAVGRWRAARARLQAASFLVAAGVSPGAVDKVWKTLGDDLEDVLRDNPWVLVKIDGIGFKEADEVAIRLGVSLESPKRLEGAVLAAVGRAPENGHLYSTMSGVIACVSDDISGASQVDVANAVRSLVGAQSLKLDRETKPGVVAIYDPAVLALEQECAQLIFDRSISISCRDLRVAYANVGPTARNAFETGQDLTIVATAALSDWSTGVKTDLTSDQITAAFQALTIPVSLLTGLPGTGKTTTLRAVVSVMRDAAIKFLLVAPTGIAAKRLSNVVNAEASTIHRAFGATGAFGGDDGEREVVYEGFLGESSKKAGSVVSEHEWEYGPGNQHPAEVVIVDEMSMVDLHMLHRVLTGTRDNCRLVFVGDPYQLPSVGAGDVLGDLVESKVLSHSHLSQIFRQEDTSGIVLAAHAIHRGTPPESDGVDFVVVPAYSEEESSDIVARLVLKLYEKRVNFQVLSPRHAGASGVTALNERLRADLNPAALGMAEARLGGSIVREGDRVMVVKNDYKLGVSNGDVGSVRRIDRVSKEIEVAIFGAVGSAPMIVKFPLNDAFKSLRLAYAQTIHKCVHPNTMVWVNGGLVPISSIPSEGWISTPQGVKSYRNKVTNPIGPMIEFTTRHGYTITVTPDHGIDVWDSVEGRYVRREAREIAPKDWVQLLPSPSPSVENVPAVSLTAFVPEWFKRVTTFPTMMNEELAEFLGIIVAFGNVRSDGVRIFPWKKWFIGLDYSFDLTQIVSRFTDLARSLFDLDVVIDNKSKSGSGGRLFPHSAFVASPGFSTWFDLAGETLAGLRFDEERRIPLGVLKSGRSIRSAFLRGFFQSAKVTYSNPNTGYPLRDSDWRTSFQQDVPISISRIWVRTLSKRLDRELRVLLLDIGVICSQTLEHTHTKIRRYYKKSKIVLRGEDISLFSLRVGFSVAEVARAASWKLLPSQIRQIPATRAEIRRVQSTLKKPGFVYGSFPLRFARDIVCQFPSDPVSGVFANRLRFFHDRVIQVTPTESESVCVEVPDGHQFIQDGFSAWNSQGQEYDVIVLPLLLTFGKQLQRNLLYTAITRARKRVFIVGQASAIVKAVKNDSAERRDTLLASRLKNLVALVGP